MSGRRGRRLVVALEAINGDVEADDVLVDVDAVVEHAGAALETAGGLVSRVDDLVGGGDNLVGRGELEGNLGRVAAVAGPGGEAAGVLNRGGLSQGGESEDGERLHDGGIWAYLCVTRCEKVKFGSGGIKGGSDEEGQTKKCIQQQSQSILYREDWGTWHLLKDTTAEREHHHPRLIFSERTAEREPNQGLPLSLPAWVRLKRLDEYAQPSSHHQAPSIRDRVKKVWLASKPSSWRCLVGRISIIVYGRNGAPGITAPPQPPQMPMSDL